MVRTTEGSIPLNRIRRARSSVGWVVTKPSRAIGYVAIRVAELTLAQLQSLHVREVKRPQIPPDRVPTFNEALAAIKGRINLYLDFKAGDLATVARTIREAGVTRQVLVYDDADSMEEWRHVAPELPLIISPP